MTVAETAKYLGISESLVYELCRDRHLAHARIGRGRGVIRIDEADVRAYLAANRVEPIPPGERPVPGNGGRGPVRPPGPGPGSPVKIGDAARARINGHSSAKP